MISTSETRYPKLTAAILAHLDADQLQEVANSSASAGWSGFCYYSETIPFWEAHKADILALARDLADDLGDGLLEMIAGFNCLEGEYSVDEVGRAIYSPEDDSELQTVRNAMAWFALEEVAREVSDLIDQYLTLEDINERWQSEREAIIEAYGEDDEPAMSEGFNNWTDALCKDGEISDWQYENTVLNDNDTSVVEYAEGS